MVSISSLKQKMAAKTCIQQKYAIYDYTKKCAHICTKENVILEINSQLAQNVLIAMIMKVNHHQMVESLN